MSIDVLEDTAATLTIYPPERMSAPNCSFVSPAGAELATPLVTVDAVDAAVVDNGNNLKFAVELDDATGVQVGGQYLLTEASGWSVVVRVSAVDGAVVRFEGGLPEVPEAGSTFKGMGLTVTLPSGVTATRGVNYRLRFTQGQLQHTEMVHVVRQVFAPPVTASLVHKRVSRLWPSKAWTLEAAREVAEEATRLVRERIERQARYPHYYGSPTAFRTAGDSAAEYVLLRDHGLAVAGEDREVTRETLRDQYRADVGEAIEVLHYDSDDDDDLEEEADKVSFGWIQLERR